MALLICPECGSKVSSYAASCPLCGCPIDVIRKSSGSGSLSSGSTAAMNAVDEDVSSKILDRVEQAKSEGESASDLFDDRNDDIQRKARRSIDLYGGNATNTVVDITAAAKETCDDLYTTYQSLIRQLDMYCKPLLAHNPSKESVEAVADAMEYFNEESNIENNFTASLNGRSYGNVANARYLPSNECWMIEKFWRSQANNMPSVKRSATNHTGPVSSHSSSVSMESVKTVSRGMSQRQIDNEHVKASILQQMESGMRYTVPEMIQEFSFPVEGMTTQRCSALVSQLVDEHKVSRTVDKRVAFFSLTLEGEFSAKTTNSSASAVYKSLSMAQFAEYKQKVASVIAICDKRKSKFSEALQKSLDLQMKENRKEISAYIAQLQAEKANIESDISQLKTFQLKEKRVKKDSLSLIVSKINKLSVADVFKAEEERLYNLKSKAVADYASQIDKYLDCRFPARAMEKPDKEAELIENPDYTDANIPEVPSADIFSE